ncbi:MAG: amidase [Gemmatimonadaceae bacterium]|jgi:amidase|nr:amidase [Gemmatimonadaceae bacterium]
MPVDRRAFLRDAATLGAAVAATPALTLADATTPDAQPVAPRAIPPEDTRSVAELRAAMTRGALTSRALTQACLERIAAIDAAGPRVNSVIERNPDAVQIAELLDRERAAGRVRGPLHGIPILIKDNIDTFDQMRTSAGSLALATSRAARDAFVVERLRAAGAVLLGKTNLSEWANFRSTRSTSGWSSRGGQTRNPHVLDRNPCGSSSGTGAAIASGLAPLGIGTETDGSIMCPSGICGIVGVKPTVGLWSRAGIIPISASQDTAGPMTRHVADAAELLAALAGPDARDPVSAASAAYVPPAVDTILRTDGLRGVRLGVARNLAGFDPRVDALFDEALRALRDAGAVLVDPANVANAGKFGDAEGDVLYYEFKAGLEAYFATLGPTAPLRTLDDLLAYNERERTRVMPWFGQEHVERAARKGPLTDAAYRAARESSYRMAAIEGISATLAVHRLDAIVFPTNGPAWVTDLVNGDRYTGGDSSFAAVAGYPSVTVPMGFVQSLPIGVSFVGAAWNDFLLLRFAYAFEQATRARRAPRYLASLGGA